MGAVGVRGAGRAACAPAAWVRAGWRVRCRVRPARVHPSAGARGAGGRWRRAGAAGSRLHLSYIRIYVCILKFIDTVEHDFSRLKTRSRSTTRGAGRATPAAAAFARCAR